MTVADTRWEVRQLAPGRWVATGPGGVLLIGRTWDEVFGLAARYQQRLDRLNVAPSYMLVDDRTHRMRYHDGGPVWEGSFQRPARTDRQMPRWLWWALLWLLIVGLIAGFVAGGLWLFDPYSGVLR